MSETFDGSEMVREARGGFLRHGDLYDGVVHTPHATVAVTGCTAEKWQTVRLETVRDGRLYYHWERRPASRTLTERGLKTYARRWARELEERLRGEGGGE